MTPATCLALVALSAARVVAEPFAVGDLPRVRCVSNYLYGEPSHDLDAWRRDLDRMKADGFNTVWIVNVWAEYEPSVEPVEWKVDLLRKLHQICDEARTRGMWVVLPLAYIGEGWGPKGVDVPVWPLVEKHLKQHLTFLARMAAVTRDCPNVFYLLCTEEILPGTLLYKPNERPECVRAFREWARRANSDIAYWNERWGTTYTWDTLAPADTQHRPRWQLWADHNRWFGSLMRDLLPPMVKALRGVKPGAVIGLHDFLMPMGLGLTAADGALPSPSLFDFYSIGYYYDHGLAGGLEANLAELAKRVDRAHELYPGTPLFCGELGLDVPKAPPDARSVGEALQADFLLRATTYLTEQRVGFSLWDWRTVVEREPRTHSLVREDGSDTPALAGLRKAWTLR